MATVTAILLAVEEAKDEMEQQLEAAMEERAEMEEDQTEYTHQQVRHAHVTLVCFRGWRGQTCICATLACCGVPGIRTPQPQKYCHM